MSIIHTIKRNLSFENSMNESVEGIVSMAQKYGKKITAERAEKIWNDAKKQADERRSKIKGDYYAYVMGIVKKMLGIQEDVAVFLPNVINENTFYPASNKYLFVCDESYGFGVIQEGHCGNIPAVGIAVGGISKRTERLINCILEGKQKITDTTWPQLDKYRPIIVLNEDALYSQLHGIFFHNGYTHNPLGKMFCIETSYLFQEAVFPVDTAMQLRESVSSHFDARLNTIWQTLGTSGQLYSKHILHSTAKGIPFFICRARLKEDVDVTGRIQEEFKKFMPGAAMVKLYQENREVEFGFYPTPDYWQQVLNEDYPYFPNDPIDGLQSVYLDLPQVVDRCKKALFEAELIESGAATSCWELRNKSHSFKSALELLVPCSYAKGGPRGRAFESRLMYITKLAEKHFGQDLPYELAERKAIGVYESQQEKRTPATVLYSRPPEDLAYTRKIATINSTEVPFLFTAKNESLGTGGDFIAEASEYSKEKAKLKQEYQKKEKAIGDAYEDKIEMWRDKRNYYDELKHSKSWPKKEWEAKGYAKKEQEVIDKIDYLKNELEQKIADLRAEYAPKVEALFDKYQKESVSAVRGSLAESVKLGIRKVVKEDYEGNPGNDPVEDGRQELAAEYKKEYDALLKEEYEEHQRATKVLWPYLRNILNVDRSPYARSMFSMIEELISWPFAVFYNRFTTGKWKVSRPPGVLDPKLNFRGIYDAIKKWREDRAMHYASIDTGLVAGPSMAVEQFNEKAKQYGVDIEKLIEVYDRKARDLAHRYQGKWEETLRKASGDARGRYPKYLTDVSYFLKEFVNESLLCDADTKCKAMPYLFESTDFKSLMEFIIQLIFSLYRKPGEKIEIDKALNILREKYAELLNDYDIEFAQRRDEIEQTENEGDRESKLEGLAFERQDKVEEITDQFLDDIESLKKRYGIEESVLNEGIWSGLKAIWDKHKVNQMQEEYSSILQYLKERLPSSEWDRVQARVNSFTQEMASKSGMKEISPGEYHKAGSLFSKEVGMSVQNLRASVEKMMQFLRDEKVKSERISSSQEKEVKESLVLTEMRYTPTEETERLHQEIYNIQVWLRRNMSENDYAQLHKKIRKEFDEYSEKWNKVKGEVKDDEKRERLQNEIGYEWVRRQLEMLKQKFNFVYRQFSPLVRRQLEMRKQAKNRMGDAQQDESVGKINEVFMLCSPGNYLIACNKGNTVDVYHGVACNMSPDPKIYDHYPRLLAAGRGKK